MKRLAVTLALTFACTAAAGQSRLDNPSFDQLSPESRRTIFLTEYQEFVARTRPSLNYVRTGLSKRKGGYFLYATHRLFTPYEFDAGAFGPAVGDWVARYSYRLRNAGITQVGFRTEEGGEAWFNTR